MIHYDLFTAVVFALLVAVVGMPHGGLDKLFGRAVFQPMVGWSWWLVFLGFYLGIAAFVVVGWLYAPAVTVILFFAISAFHFGDADGRTGALAVLEGGMVIWMTLLARPVETATILAWIIPGGEQDGVLAVLVLLRPLLFIIVGLLAVHLVRLLIVGEWQTSVRLVLFAVALALLPVLVGFGLYFCGWHSTREMISLARRAEPGSLGVGLIKVLRLAAPSACLAVLATGLAAWWFAADRDLTPVVVQAVFIGLSSVAIPHILLHAVARRLGADPFAPESVQCPAVATT
jgi:Brp/Blh family beta-carotene 15,15'-monooxygenase